ncbi:unnamed protein product [Amoebophrya sp. A120]|nr:unnamed protein product [Amoebophrya sp. A120]|eukprot:GSA120T00013443001.1
MPIKTSETDLQAELRTLFAELPSLDQARQAFSFPGGGEDPGAGDNNPGTKKKAMKKKKRQGTVSSTTETNSTVAVAAVGRAPSKKQDVKITATVTVPSVVVSEAASTSKLPSSMKKSKKRKAGKNATTTGEDKDKKDGNQTARTQHNENIAEQAKMKNATEKPPEPPLKKQKTKAPVTNTTASRSVAPSVIVDQPKEPKVSAVSSLLASLKARQNGGAQPTEVVAGSGAADQPAISTTLGGPGASTAGGGAEGRDKNGTQQRDQQPSAGGETAGKTKKNKNKGKNKISKQDEDASVGESTPAAPQPQLSAKLQAARFRELNEQLYTSTGQNALRWWKSQPHLFEKYHAGFAEQVRKWPSNPVDVLIEFLEKKFSISTASNGTMRTSGVVAHDDSDEGRHARVQGKKQVSYDDRDDMSIESEEEEELEEEDSALSQSDAEILGGDSDVDLDDEMSEEEEEEGLSSDEDAVLSKKEKNKEGTKSAADSGSDDEAAGQTTTSKNKQEGTSLPSSSTTSSFFNITDLGCGEAKIARQLEGRFVSIQSTGGTTGGGSEQVDQVSGQKGSTRKSQVVTKKQIKVHNFDLVSREIERSSSCDGKNLKTNSTTIKIQAANINQHVPLATGTQDVVILCLALMGTDCLNAIKEASRLLKPKTGLLLIAEVQSRFQESGVEKFVADVEKNGNCWRMKQREQSRLFEENSNTHFFIKGFYRWGLFLAGSKETAATSSTTGEKQKDGACAESGSTDVPWKTKGNSKGKGKNHIKGQNKPQGGGGKKGKGKGKGGKNKSKGGKSSDQGNKGKRAVGKGSGDKNAGWTAPKACIYKRR